MKRIYKLLILLSVLTVSSQAAIKTVKHKVKKGDNLYSPSPRKIIQRLRLSKKPMV